MAEELDFIPPSLSLLFIARSSLAEFFGRIQRPCLQAMVGEKQYRETSSATQTGVHVYVRVKLQLIQYLLYALDILFAPNPIESSLRSTLQLGDKKNKKPLNSLGTCGEWRRLYLSSKTLD